MEKLLELEHAQLGYRKITVLNDVSLSINKGDFLGIIGPNGTGKTTFLKTLMGLLKLKKGKIIKYTDIKFGYCMQRDFLSTIFPFTVMEIVLMMRTFYWKPFRGYTDNDCQTVIKSLRYCGIEHLANKRFYNLSGGQQQRVIIARALSLEPDILILDEPTIDLDIKGKKEILDLILKLHHEYQLTVLLASHELNQVINYADKFLFFADNRCFGVYHKKELSAEVLSKIFGMDIEICLFNNKQLIIL
ncbi:MAG: metal ABC transporter ATP-binding protein [Candidatus Omnitrophica bacterium]|nr:metal ABC transporter ATP-binding protein [Candidatus Omnitrophota bacterium]MCM8829820.1 metal ABC transporter ATP-binding protein [Candidatus Omnitrophota bacterium]